MNRDVRQLVQAAVRAGAKVEYSRKHIRVCCPGGIVILAGTPSDGRAVLNDRARLRRNGLDI